jgi:hypothetical protein
MIISFVFMDSFEMHVDYRMAYITGHAHESLRPDATWGMTERYPSTATFGSASSCDWWDECLLDHASGTSAAT